MEYFDENVLSNDSVTILKKFYNDLFDVRCIAEELGCPVFQGKHPIFGQKLCQINGHLEEQKLALLKCQNIRKEILNLIDELHDVCAQVDDVSLGVVNSFETEYDCDMFIKGSMYQSKFLNGVRHWRVDCAKEEWKLEYDKCLELFKKVTSGLVTHNFRIFYMEEGYKGVFGFTVHGVPGDFEVSFPLNSKEYYVRKTGLDSSSLPMQMRLTWRRRWVVPNYDYFFDDFGAYTVSEVNSKLFEFVSTEKWKEFYNPKSYMKDCIDADSGNKHHVVVEYDEKTRNYLENVLSEEIEACSKEGKKIR